MKRDALNSQYTVCGNGEYKDAVVNGSTSLELELLIFFFFLQIRMLIYMFSIVFPENIRRSLLKIFKMVSLTLGLNAAAVNYLYVSIYVCE